MSEGLRLSEIAAHLGATLHGEGDATISAVKPLEEAVAGELAFLTSSRWRRLAEASQASALVVREDHADLRTDERAVLVVADPGRAMVQVLELLHPPARPASGVHPTAVVDEDARLAPDVSVGPYAVIGPGSELAAGVAVGAHCVIGRDCVLGEGTVLRPHVVLYDGTVLGRGVLVHSGVVLGADGFGYESRADGHHKVPQVGHVVIEDEVEIGANSCVDRATLTTTRVGAGSKLDNMVQLGHNVTIGRGTLICAQTGIGGSTDIGEGVVLGGQVGVVDHVRVGDGVQVAASSKVLRNAESGLVMSGTVPAIDIRRWRRTALRLGDLDDMYRRLRRLERALADAGADGDDGFETGGG